MKYGAAELEQVFAVHLRAVSNALDALGAEVMLIGGLAVGVWTEPRGTKDADFAVGVTAEPAALAASLRAAGLEVVRGDLGRALAEGASVRLRVTDTEESSVVVDLLFAGTPFEREALARRVEADVLGVRLYVATPEDLLIYKLIAGRPQDLADADRLLALHRSQLDLARVRRWCEAFGVEDRAETLLGAARP